MGTVTPIADAEISRLLEAGDTDGAALLAAKLERPQEYTDALRRIGEIVNVGMYNSKGNHLTTPNETAALKDVSEKFMFGDLLKVLMGEIRQLSVPFATLPELQQQKVIDRITERTEKAVKEVVQIIASKARPMVQVDIESVMFKDGIKVTLTCSKQAADRHAIADAAGHGALLILPDYEPVLGGDAPKADKDQPDMLDGKH